MTDDVGSAFALGGAAIGVIGFAVLVYYRVCKAKTAA